MVNTQTELPEDEGGKKRTKPTAASDESIPTAKTAKQIEDLITQKGEVIIERLDPKQPIKVTLPSSVIQLLSKEQEYGTDNPSEDLKNLYTTWKEEGGVCRLFYKLR